MALNSPPCPHYPHHANIGGRNELFAATVDVAHGNGNCCYHLPEAHSVHCVCVSLFRIRL